MHTVVRPPWGRRFTCRYPRVWIAETTLRLRVAGAPCGRYFQASRGDGIRVRMAGLARGRAAPVRRRDPGAGVLAAERGGGVRAGGRGRAGRAGGSGAGAVLRRRHARLSRRELRLTATSP